MIYTFTLAIALVIAIVRGGRLANVASIRWHFGWLILVAFGLQVAVVYLPQFQSAGRGELPAALIVLSYAMLLVGVFANHRIGGMRLLGLGLLLNFVVILANGGFMPIAPDAASDLGLLPQGFDIQEGMRVAKSKDIILAPAQTTFWMLSDVFVASRYIPVKTVFSIGDAIGAIGLFFAIQRAMLPRRTEGDSRSLKPSPRYRSILARLRLATGLDRISSRP